MPNVSRNHAENPRFVFIVFLACFALFLTFFGLFLVHIARDPRFTFAALRFNPIPKAYFATVNARANHAPQESAL